MSNGRFSPVTSPARSHKSYELELSPDESRRSQRKDRRTDQRSLSPPPSKSPFASLSSDTLPPSYESFHSPQGSMRSNATSSKYNSIMNYLEHEAKETSDQLRSNGATDKTNQSPIRHGAAYHQSDRNALPPDYGDMNFDDDVEDDVSSISQSPASKPGSFSRQVFGAPAYSSGLSRGTVMDRASDAISRSGASSSSGRGKYVWDEIGEMGTSANPTGAQNRGNGESRTAAIDANKAVVTETYFSEMLYSRGGYGNSAYDHSLNSHAQSDTVSATRRNGYSVTGVGTGYGGAGDERSVTSASAGGASAASGGTIETVVGELKEKLAKLKDDLQSKVRE